MSHEWINEWIKCGTSDNGIIITAKKKRAIKLKRHGGNLNACYCYC